MWGAVIGDLAGSVYEFEQLKGIKSIKTNEIIPNNAFFSDDTILTMAIVEAVQTDMNYEEHLKKYGKLYRDYKPDIKPYFNGSFSPGFLKWCDTDERGTSIGNGAMMRISPIGFSFDNEIDVKKNARLATVPSHDSKEAIVYSTLIALIIFYAKNKVPKDEILKKLNIKLKCESFKKFNTTCSQTFDNCVWSAFNSNSFEESIKKILSFGGDTDTNACIVGSIAEALYGIDESLIIKAKQYIPTNFIGILEKEYAHVKGFDR